VNNVVLHLGSNIGDRLAQLNMAFELIAAQIGPVINQSSVFETEAWGKKDQDNFLNQAALVHTTLSAEETLLKCKDIEKQMGSVKTETWGPRNIDIDVLFYNESIIDKENIKIPHPMIEKRNFVLIPLMEIMGEMVHPVLGKTIEELYEESNDPCEVWIYD
jgi:2-amino-4-hydroxy-6-hydroxymethyldihydropteridine diphosphokinase